ncbi:hypothetical protein OQY15_22320 [Pedobacter sp. MC2016-15]|uniref:hypothetical protein n=1 Tax=Pedobacter sp. MC2016-15 TaxID=2994473 RepID=UPI0022465CD3|nr:hypothetical protein [Pedobacter sp. MC2016-15]MCX2481852.1 hypothetical protein [Pedobacter sp. MC2016-15]
MEKLTIHIPDKKSSMVKQILKELGVIFQHETHASLSGYKAKLTKISTWSDTDLKDLEVGSKGFEDLKAEQW